MKFAKKFYDMVKKLEEIGTVINNSAKARNGGIALLVKCKNGYDASIICCDGSMGGPSGLYEIAVVRNGNIVYNTPITNDVIGYLTENRVVDTVNQIALLRR